MQHRELYRSIVPADAHIITYSDLAKASTCAAAKRIASSIYYKIDDNYSSEVMKRGTEAHKIKEAELSDRWDNEVRLAYKMDGDYYLTGTIDRYYKIGIVEDFKTTVSPASSYMKTSQIETYAFLAMNNDLMVNSGIYTTINEKGEALDGDGIDIYASTVVHCYSTFILPRFNMIKKEIERLRYQYVGEPNTSDPE